MRDNLGEFIKEQRIKNNISQNKLAEILFIDRTLISKWENGKANPSMNELVKMAKLFSVSIEEFISCEVYTGNNKGIIEDNLSNYLIDQDVKIHKTEIYLFYSLLIVLLLLISFFAYYFYNTFNKTLVYRIGGESSKYNFENGILLLTRDSSYMKIGYFDLNIKEIEIFYEENNEKKIIYKGEPNNVVIDSKRSNNSINIRNFKKYKDILYMTIYDMDNEQYTMKLYFKNDFVNNKLLFENKENEKLFLSESNINGIPSFIQKYFVCDDFICWFNENLCVVKYDISRKLLYFIFEENTYIYNIEKSEYESDDFNDLYNHFDNNMDYNIINNYVKKYLDRGEGE